MALTGYEFFEDLLAKTGMFPRLLEGIKLIRSDEGRHLVHGMDFLREQLRQHPEHVAPVRELFPQQAASLPRRTKFTSPIRLDWTATASSKFPTLTITSVCARQDWNTSI